MRKVTIAALATLIAAGQASGAFAAQASGMDSNRAALNLPTNARVGTCVNGAGCDAPGTSQLVGAPSFAVPVLLAGVAGVVGGGIAIGTEKSHPHYTPVSP